MRLVITEKPSVARDIARVLGLGGRGDGYLEGDGIVISWCFGHLLELEEPKHYDERWRRWSFDTLPMLPEDFELRVRKGANQQWKVVRGLLRDQRFDEVVNGCDAGREGELIFRYAYQHAGSTLPIARLWLASLTEKAITKAWGALRPGHELDALADAARCRSEADWLVGLNATRAMTCLARQAGGDQLMSVGRVQTPTLAMICARDREIADFVPETFWQVKASFAVPREGDEPARWEAIWFSDDSDRERTAGDEVPKAERLVSLEHAEQIVAASTGRSGAVERAERKTQREPPPLLYDLTSLQRRANQRYGFNAGQTLELAQALYEKHKLLSYPRTDARYLTDDQVPELPGVLQGLRGVAAYAPFVDALLAAPIAPGKRVVDASEVGDHHAIIPTGRSPQSARLSPDEKRIFDLVARRLMAALSPDAVFERTALVVAVDVGQAPLPEGIASPLRYRARGRVCVEEGWRAIDPPKTSKETLLPLVDEGVLAEVEKAWTHEGQTRPPRPHTDASILQAMETAGKKLDDAELKRAMRSAGLGTPATRAAILQTLIDRSFAERQKKELHATEKGFALIDAVPVDELKSAELTGRYEARLSAIAEGAEPRETFMADVRAHAREVVTAIAAAEPPPVAARAIPDGPILGECPVCKTPVRESRSVYTCEKDRACAFVVFKTMAKRKISARMVKQLLTDGRSGVVKGFKSRKNTDFEAALTIKDDGAVGFWFPPRENQGDAPAVTPRSPVGMTCPRCGAGKLIRGRAAWGCDRWRGGCRYTLSFEDGGRPLTDAEAIEQVEKASANRDPTQTG